MTTSNSDPSRSAVLQIPSASEPGKKRNVACVFIGMQGKRLGLQANEAVALSTAVSVEHDDALFLGEVVTCTPGDGNWRLEIKVEQILTGLQSLMALRARLLSEGIPQPLGLLPVGARN